ncbi:MAG: hypothetical protein U0Y10_10285 [Spirosomataceae bacterium]
MKKILMSVLLLSGMMTATLAQSVDDVVSKYMAAVGGEKWNTVNALQIISTMSGNNGDMELTTTVVKDKAYKWEMNAGMFQMTRCINGDEGWSTNPRNGGAAEAMTPDQVKNQKDQTEIPSSLFDYKAKGHTAELEGKETVDGKELYKIKLTKKSGGVDYYYVDANTYLIAKRTMVQSMMGREIQSEAIYSDYKDVEGLKIAYKTETKRIGGQGGPGGPGGGQGGGGGGQGGGRGGMGGGPVTVDKVKINPKINEKDFKMPK